MKQVSDLTGLSYDTLKFYCKEGLIPNHKRDHNNHRVFDDRDIGWIEGLICLRNCGMSLKLMKEYMGLCIDGIATISQRQKMLDETESVLDFELARILGAKKYIKNKQKYYRDVLAGEVVYASNLTNV